MCLDPVAKAACAIARENRRQLREFALSVKGTLSNLTTVGEGTPSSAKCSGHVRFESPEAPGLAQELDVQFAVRHADSKWIVDRLQPLSKLEKYSTKYAQELVDRAKQYQHEGEFLRPQGLYCTSLTSLPRAAAIETANNQYSAADIGASCDYNGDEFVPLLEVTPVMTESYRRAKLKHNGQFIWTTRKNIVAGSNGVTAEELVTRLTAPTSYMLDQLPAEYLSSGKCVLEDGRVVAYAVTDRHVQIGKLDCKYETGGMTGGGRAVATLICTEGYSAQTLQYHLVATNFGSGMRTYNLSHGGPQCQIPEGGVTEEIAPEQELPAATTAPAAVAAPAAVETAAAPAAAQSPPAASEEPVAEAVEKPADRPAREVRISQPEYPPAARRQMQMGVVVLSVEVLDTGKVGEVVVQESSGHELLDTAAVREAQVRWRFEPAIVNGKPRASTVVKKVGFALSN